MPDSACPARPITERPCNEGVVCGKELNYMLCCCVSYKVDNTVIKLYYSCNHTSQESVGPMLRVKTLLITLYTYIATVYGSCGLAMAKCDVLGGVLL